jgi:hypothetical protein
VVSVLAIVLAGWTFARQDNRDKETASIQRRLSDIEETRHTWEQQDRAEAEAQKRKAAEREMSAEFKVQFRHKDGAKSYGRLSATNQGPADARDAVLDVWADHGADRIDVTPVQGTGTQSAERLRPNEAVYTDLVFTMGRPSAEHLRYHLDWTDDRGPQSDEGRVPFD